MSVLGQQLDMPLFFAPTAMQRLFHHDGEFAIANAAAKYGTMFGVSTIGTRSIEELGSYNDNSRDLTLVATDFPNFCDASLGKNDP